MVEQLLLGFDDVRVVVDVSQDGASLEVRVRLVAGPPSGAESVERDEREAA